MKVFELSKLSAQKYGLRFTDINQDNVKSIYKVTIPNMLIHGDQSITVEPIKETSRFDASELFKGLLSSSNYVNDYFFEASEDQQPIEFWFYYNGHCLVFSGCIEFNGIVRNACDHLIFINDKITGENSFTDTIEISMLKD